MKLQIEYIHSGKPDTVVTLPADIIKWERYTKSKFSDLWSKDELRIGLEDLAVFVWAVLSRKQLTNEPFEIWLDNLDEISDFAEPEPVNPTVAEASSDSV